MTAMVLAAVLGAAIGLVVGLLGAGGSILAVPALVYGLGQPFHQAVPASLVVVGVSAAGGLLPRLRRGLVRWPVAAVFAAAGVVTAFGGAAVSRLLPARLLLLGFAGLMVVVAVRMLRGEPEPTGSCAAPDGRVDWRGCLPKALLTGAGVGFLTGLFGVGGGFVVVPALVLLLALPMDLAVGTSLVIIAVNAAAGFVAHMRGARLDGVTVAFALAALLTSLAAGKWASTLHNDRLTRWFAYLIVAVAVFVAVATVRDPAALG